MSWTTFLQIARDSGGVVLLPEAARAADVSPRWAARRTAREGWWRPFPNVAALPGTPIDGRTRALAATQHLRGRLGDAERDLVAVTRWTAAHLYGVHRRAPSKVQVVVAAPRHLQRRAGIEIVRSRDLSTSDLRRIDRVPLVTPCRLLREMAAVCELGRLRALTIDLLQRRLLSLDELRSALATWPTFLGRALLRQVVEELAAAGRTDSPPELLARHRLAAAGIRLDRGQVPVPLLGGDVINLDLGILAIRFAIEMNSFAFHSSRADVTRDARRSNAIAEVEDDWRVLQLTWDILEGDWDAFVAQVREVVAAQSRRHLGMPWPRPSDLRS